MASRKGAILELAEQASEILIDSLPANRVIAKTNYRNIADVCRKLLSRPKAPWMPTAELVSDTGRTSVPAARTIHNVYADMMRIWKRAYDDLINISSNDPVSVDELPFVDLTDATPDLKHAFQEMYRHLREVHQRNNALKRLITDSVPVDADHVPETSGRSIEALGCWLDQLHAGLFTLDQEGLKVSRKSPVGTIIIDAEMLSDLRTLVDDFNSSERRRRKSWGCQASARPTTPR